jgi:hypothetical protein
MSNSSDSSSGGATAPVDYEPPLKPQRFGQTKFGYLALLFAMAQAVLMLAFYLSARSVAQRISDFEFDFGIFVFAITLIFALLGLFQQRASRVAALVAIGVVVLTVLFF